MFYGAHTEKSKRSESTELPLRNDRNNNKGPPLN